MYFGQCPKKNVILLLMSSIKPDESMRELPRKNEIELKINYTIFKTKITTGIRQKLLKGYPPSPPRG